MKSLKVTLSGIQKILGAVKEVAVEVVKLKRPATAAAVVAFILAVLPGVNLSATALTAIVMGVGVVAGVIEKIAQDLLDSK